MENAVLALIELNMKIKRAIFYFLMNVLRKSANLEIKSAILNIGEVVYLDNVKKTGEKDPLILIHGLGADKDTWLQFAKYLTKNFRIIIPDLPGHGVSIQDISIDYSVEAQAKYVLELIKDLKISRAHYIGSSMGGAVATRLAYMQPEAVSSLILIDSYGAIKSPSYVYKLAEEIGHNPMLEIKNKSDYKKMVSLAMFKPPFIPEFMLDVLTDGMSGRAALNKKVFKDSELDSDLSSILPMLTAPTLVVWGAEDKVLHVDNADIFYSELQNCSKVVLENTGHVPMVEKPKETAAHVTKFLKENGKNEGAVSIS